MKKILLADSDKNTTMTLEYMLNAKGYGDIDTANNYESGLKLFKTNEYDFVIIDFASQGGNRLLNEILMLNKKQRIITLSEDAHCSDEIGCDFCIEHYKKRRVVKPYMLYDILKLLEKFDALECQNKNVFEPKNLAK